MATEGSLGGRVVGALRDVPTAAAYEGGGVIVLAGYGVGGLNGPQAV